MTKTVRLLIVIIVFLLLILFSQGMDLPGSTAGKSISAFRVEPTALADVDNSTLRQKLILIEFFAGF